MTEHEKNEDRFRGQGVVLGLEHVDLNHLGSGVDRAVDLIPEGKLFLLSILEIPTLSPVDTYLFHT